MRALTREELYELVWSRPTRDLARELGVSDVWIGKVCRRAAIPKPTPGYWQQRAAGKTAPRPALPSPLPLQTKDMYVLGGAAAWGPMSPSVDWAALEQNNAPLPPPPEPPVFGDSLDQVREAAEHWVTPLPFNQSLRQCHPATRRLLEGDERRAGEDRTYSVSWRTPRYRHASGKELLTALNRLFWAWTALGAEVNVAGQINQSLTITVWGRSLALSALDYGWPGNVLQPSFKPGAPFALYWDHIVPGERWAPSPRVVYQEFDDFPNDVLRALLVDSIVRTEAALRDHQQKKYQWALARRNETIKSREARREAEHQQREIQRSQRAQERLALLHDAVASIHQAEQLRSLVETFDAKVEAEAETVPGYAAWRAWALAQAATLDPRTLPPDDLAHWVARFRLDEPE